jgi:hypothetical protein
MVPSILAEIALATEADRQKKHMTAKAVTTLDARCPTTPPGIWHNES